MFIKEIRIKLFSYNLSRLQLVCNQFINLLEQFRINSKLIFLPTKIEKICIPSSMFIYKKTKKHFERRKHYRLLIFNNNKISSKMLSNFSLPNDVDVLIEYS